MNEFFRRMIVSGVVAFMGISFANIVLFQKKSVDVEVVEVEEKVRKVVKKRGPASIGEVAQAIRQKTRSDSAVSISETDSRSVAESETQDKDDVSPGSSPGKVFSSGSQAGKSSSRTFASQEKGRSSNPSKTSASTSKSVVTGGASFVGQSPSSIGSDSNSGDGDESAPGSGSSTGVSFSISSIAIDEGKLILKGNNLTAVKNVYINGNSVSATLVKISATASEVVALGLSGIQLALGKVYNVIISDANASTTFPVEITLEDGTITADKLAPLSAAEDGYVLKWDDSAGAWVAAPDDGGGGGGGSVTSITRGTGLVSSGSSITTTGTIAVDVGVGANQIPVFDASKKISLNSSNIVELSPGSYVGFKDATEEYRLQVASDVFQLWSVVDNAAILEVNGSTLSVNGQGVCLANGTNCPASSGVTSITAGSGLLGGTITTTGTISVDVDNSTVEIATNKLRLKDGGVTAAKLNQMGAGVGSVLKWTVAGWAPAADSGLTSESDPNVQAFAKAVIPSCAADETLSAVLPLADAFTCTSIALDSDAVTEGATNQFFTDARARASAVSDSITNGIMDIAPSQNAVYDALALKQDTLNSSSDVSVRSLDVSRTWTASSGTEYIMRVLPTANQSGTAGYTGLFMDVTETATGSGAKKLIDLRVGGVSKFSVDATGAVTSTTSTNGTTANFTSAGGSQFVVGYDGTNKTTVNVDSLGFTTFTASGTSAGFNFAGGKVGIGVAVPSEALDVTGSVKASTSVKTPLLSNTNDLSLTADSDSDANGALIFNTGTNERLRILNGGNVGIGTTAPATRLTIQATHNTANATTYTGALLIHDEANSVLPHLGAGVSYNGGNQHSWIQSNSSIGVYPLALQPAGGSVGIGTATPDTKLKVEGTLGLQTVHTRDKIRLWSANDAHNLGTEAYYNTYGPNTWTGAIIGHKFYGEAGTVLAEIGEGNGANRSYFSGSVGIGTTSPSYQFQNVAASGTAKDLLLSGVTGLSNGFGIQYSGATTGNFMNYYFLDGKVGIGTTSPGYKLTVVGPSTFATQLGQAQIADSATAMAMNFGAGTDASANKLTWIQSTESGVSNIRNLGLQPYGGNVGIGTTSPSTALDVNGAIVARGAVATNVASTAIFDFFGTSTRVLSRGPDASTNGGFQMISTRGDGSNALYVLATDSSGNVGIGTTSPGGPLEVVGGNTGTAYSSGEQVLVLRNNSSVVGARGAGIRFDNGSYTGGGAQIDFINSGTTNEGHLSFGTRYSGTMTEKVRIQNDGRVGIGTTAPLGKLHVIGVGSYNSGLVVQSPNAVQSLDIMPGYSLDGTAEGVQDNTTMTIRSSGTVSGNLAIATGNTERFRVAANGDVGIGTTTPSEKLHVVGNILASGTITPSDRRLKKNIRPVEGALEKIDKLHGVTYDWKDPNKHGKTRQLGVIAQDVKAVFPEAVTKTNDGFLAVSYSVLVSPLISAVKELYGLVKGLYHRVVANEKKTDREIAALKEQMKKMNRAPASEHTQRIKQLETENEAMRSYLCQKDPAAPFCGKKRH